MNVVGDDLKLDGRGHCERLLSEGIRGKGKGIGKGGPT